MGTLTYPIRLVGHRKAILNLPDNLSSSDVSRLISWLNLISENPVATPNYAECAALIVRYLAPLKFH